MTEQTARSDDDVFTTLYVDTTPPEGQRRRQPGSDRDTSLGGLGTTLFFAIPLTLFLVAGYLIALVWP
jgi:hypothetical protein